MKFFNRAPSPKPEFVVTDMSRETFGKYQHCTQHDGVWYSDEDFDAGFGVGRPKRGAIPSPSEEDRTPFGQKRKPILETEAMKKVRWARERQETHALLEQLASELVPEVAAEQTEWLMKYQAEYDRDCSGYSFDCKKHGDFLSLFITRSANEAGLLGGPSVKLHATTINLRDCKEIHCTAGHGPDLKGVVEFRFNLNYDNGGSSSGTGYGDFAAPAGAKWTVHRPQCRTSYSRELFRLDPKPDPDHHNVMCFGDPSYKIKTAIPNTARAAADDTIYFNGVGTLFAPANRGGGVHEIILTELSAP